MLSNEWNLFADLRTADNTGHISQVVSERAKREIQGGDGLIKAMRDLDPNRKYREQALRSEKTSLRSTDDESINNLLNSFQRTNEEAIDLIAKDFVHQALPICDKSQHPVTYRIVRLLAGDEISQRFRLQLLATIQQHIEMSLTQSRKSLAGSGGEHAFEAILIASGLSEGVHYTKQFKTGAGSDADFVIPAAAPGEFHKVQLMIAVQISSNDRMKLTKGELLPGARPFIATFNGFDASTKIMRDIGNEIITSQLQNRVRLICGTQQRLSEIERIKKLREKKDDEALARREQYFTDYVDSFEQFSADIKQQFHS